MSDKYANSSSPLVRAKPKMATDIPASITTPDSGRDAAGHVALLRRLPGRGDRADGL